MSTLIFNVDTLLGLLVPALFVVILIITGRSESGRRFRGVSRGLISGIAGWTLLIWLTGFLGIFEYREGDMFPRFLIPLFLPVVAGVALLFNKRVREFLDQIPMARLVRFQFWRIFGFIFFVVALTNAGPPELVISGFGDLLTGILAIITAFMISKQRSGYRFFAWLFNLVGITDLLVILYIFLVNYPIWSNTVPSSAIAGAFPLILVVGIAAPIALIFHIMTVRRMILHLMATRRKKGLPAIENASLT